MLHGGGATLLKPHKFVIVFLCSRWKSLYLLLFLFLIVFFLFFRQQDLVSMSSWTLTATPLLVHAVTLWIWSHIHLTPTVTFKLDTPFQIFMRGKKKILLLAWFHNYDRQWKVKLFPKKHAWTIFPLPVQSLMWRDILTLLSHSICFLSLIIWTLWAQVLDKHSTGICS